MNIVSQVVLIKFMNEPTVTYKTVRAHELRLLRIGNSNLTRLPWSIWGKSGGATEVGTVDINSSCNSTKTEIASHSLPKLSHCNVVSFTSSPVLSTICNTTHTLWHARTAFNMDWHMYVAFHSKIIMHWLLLLYGNRHVMCELYAQGSVLAVLDPSVLQALQCTTSWANNRCILIWQVPRYHDWLMSWHSEQSDASHFLSDMTCLHPYLPIRSHATFAVLQLQV